MTLVPQRGRCFHCGHDHDLDLSPQPDIRMVALERKLTAAEATLAKLREIVPETPGWCYDCDTVVSVYHYGGKWNPNCAKCKGAKTDELSDQTEELIRQIRAILYAEGKT